jgi:UDP-N-acetylglucosamine--N-acetylmuramyl-(pentapeptide) pyrophosphoryl-undecaprenol N-acetylglucosamine transferase
MFPALAVADRLSSQGRAIALLTDSRGAHYVVDRSHRIISAGSPTGGLGKAARGGLLLLRGAGEAIACFRELRPPAAALFGGYAVVPAALAAVLARTPVLVHEQNAVCGKANRLASRAARVLALSFDGTRGVPDRPGAARMVTGNPVRPGFGAAAASAESKPGGYVQILVLGGSQGARIFSEVLPQAFNRLPAALRQRIRLAQQCRPEDLERARVAYANLGLAAELQPFFQDVPQRMASADIVVARAGASTIAEILALGRSSILIPYPHAAEDHQTANAKALADLGAAALVPQPEATPERLAAALANLVEAPERRAAMRAAARQLARPDAADRLAEAVLELADEGARS